MSNIDIRWKLDGKLAVPCDRIAWCEWFETHYEERIVDKTIVGAYEISTVFIGLDHGFGLPEPLIFETMIFADSSGEGHYTQRYATWDDAEKGHAKAVEWAQKRIIQIEGQLKIDDVFANTDRFRSND